MIKIDQLLESVDLDFEPRWVTKGESGYVEIWSNKPKAGATTWYHISEDTICQSICKLKLSEFDGKDWTECIYEVPRKTTGKIEHFFNECGDDIVDEQEYQMTGKAIKKLNLLVDAVNKHADIIQQIGDWGTRKGECLWCETLTKFEPSELKGAKK